MKSFISIGTIVLLAPVISFGASSKKATMTYNHDVKPILDASCISCHKGAHPPKNVDLTTYAKIMADKVGGVKIVKPGNAANSLLYKVLKGHPVQMPPSGALPAAKTTTIQKWINQGAKKQ